MQGLLHCVWPKEMPFSEVEEEEKKIIKKVGNLAGEQIGGWDATIRKRNIRLENLTVISGIFLTRVPMTCRGLRVLLNETRQQPQQEALQFIQGYKNKPGHETIGWFSRRSINEHESVHGVWPRLLLINRKATFCKGVPEFLLCRQHAGAGFGLENMPEKTDSVVSSRWMFFRQTWSQHQEESQARQPLLRGQKQMSGFWEWPRKLRNVIWVFADSTKVTGDNGVFDAQCGANRVRTVRSETLNNKLLYLETLVVHWCETMLTDTSNMPAVN